MACNRVWYPAGWLWIYSNRNTSPCCRRIYILSAKFQSDTPKMELNIGVEEEQLLCLPLRSVPFLYSSLRGGTHSLAFAARISLITANYLYIKIRLRPSPTPPVNEWNAVYFLPYKAGRAKCIYVSPILPRRAVSALHLLLRPLLCLRYNFTFISLSLSEWPTASWISCLRPMDDDDDDTWEYIIIH